MCAILSVLAIVDIRINFISICLTVLSNSFKLLLSPSQTSKHWHFSVVEVWYQRSSIFLWEYGKRLSLKPNFTHLCKISLRSLLAMCFRISVTDLSVLQCQHYFLFVCLFNYFGEFGKLWILLFYFFESSLCHTFTKCTTLLNFR